jgi:hypothetical protein
LHIKGIGKSKKSLFARFLKSMEDNAGVSIPVGKDIDHLVGNTFKFERTDINFGDFTVEGFALPVELIEDKPKKAKSKSKDKKKSKAKAKVKEPEPEDDEDEDEDEDESETDDDDEWED